MKNEEGVTEHYNGIETFISERYSPDKKLTERIETQLDEEKKLNAEFYDSSLTHVKTVRGLFGPTYEYSPETLNIAVLGDLHGNIELALNILDRWQKKTKRQLDYILQVGDLGAFPDITRLDKTTRNFAKKHPEELGFQKFYNQTPEGDYFFGENACFSKDLVLYFIKGNHEDLDFLSQHKNDSVDHYHRFIYVLNDEIITLSRKNKRIKIASLGGIEQDGFTSKEAKRLYAQEFDVLLTHQHLKDEQRPCGSAEIVSLIENAQPKFHFSGHVHKEGKLSFIGDTESYNLNEVKFRGKHLAPNSIGILSVNDDTQDFSFINHYWLEEIKK
ncbi:hypothetical protein GOV06_02035 [Candidatus Woesearchaeota archaeon]|nr:hypothetical protein [Candidatus Woesearchaeota archaeon]